MIGKTNSQANVDESLLASIIGGTNSGYDFPEYVTMIPAGFYSNNKVIDTVPIHNGITSFGICSFTESSIKSITFPPNLKHLGDLYGETFRKCTQLEEVVCNEGLEATAWEEFMGCTSLLTFTFPASVHYVGSGFNNCTSLHTVTFMGRDPSLSAISSLCFSGCLNLTTINVPWPEGDVSGAPWGAVNATINYNYVP